MKKKTCKCGFGINNDEDLDLDAGVTSYFDVKYCPVCGETLEEKEEEEE